MWDLGVEKVGDCWEMRYRQMVEDLVFTRGKFRGHCGFLVKNGVQKGK